VTTRVEIILQGSDQLSGPVRAAKTELGGLSGAAQNAGGALGFLQNAFSFATGGVIQGINSIAGSIGGVASAMIGGNAQFETYQTQFGVLLGSAQAAKDRLGELAAFGASTPFELPQVVEADKILQSFGLHAVDTAAKFGMSGADIRTVAGDVASGTGASFSEIAGYIGKFASGATGEALARFQELGIVTKSELAGMGVAFDKAGSMTTPVNDAMDILLVAMKDKFYGIWDKNDGSTRVSGRSELQRQKVLTNVSLSLDGSGNTVVSSCTYGSTGCLPVYTACQPNYTAASSDSNESDPLCPSDVAYPDGTGIQLGWVFDLQGTGERTRSTVPTLNGGVITFTSLTPTSVDPCTASTTGIEHNLSTRTGGAPPSPVFVLSGHESNYVTLPSGFIPGLTSAIQIVPGGRVLAGGAADNPVGFSARPPSDVVPPVAGLPSPPPPGTSCIADDCSSYGYVSGFGFLFNLVKGSKYVLVCGAGASGGAVSCDWKLKLGNIGRVQWKQIQR
jgi:hypothetical protein